MAAVLLVPVLPFLFLGGRFEDWLQGMSEHPPSSTVTCLVVVGLLATDIFLPIPSSVISTLSGWQLGWFLGTVSTWTGMNLGAVFGFALAKRFGSGFALWFSSGEDLERMRGLIDRFGPSVLVVTRAMPVFAEASVLIAGIHQLSWRRFTPAVVASNLGIAVAYAAFGDVAERHQWLPLALGVAIALPVLVGMLAGKLITRIESDSTESGPES
jgi:uncharacterized membrane protein YdjX (TVP38/TMEM64 family)